MKALFTIAAAVSLAACAGSYNPAYYYSYIEVINLSSGPIRNLSLRVNGSPKMLVCERVDSKSICYDYFGKRRYPMQGIELSWIHADGAKRTDSLATAVPAYFSTGLPLQVFVEIGADGSVKLYYRQVERFDASISPSAA